MVFLPVRNHYLSLYFNERNIEANLGNVLDFWLSEGCVSHNSAALKLGIQLLPHVSLRLGSEYMQVLHPTRARCAIQSHTVTCDQYCTVHVT